MGRYVMKRLLSAVPVLMIVGIIAFALSHLSGGDPARVVAGDDAPTEQVEACLLYTSPSPRDSPSSRMPSSA